MLHQMKEMGGCSLQSISGDQWKADQKRGVSSVPSPTDRPVLPSQASIYPLHSVAPLREGPERSLVGGVLCVPHRKRTEATDP